MAESIQTSDCNQETASIAMLNSDTEMHNQLKNLYRRCRDNFRTNPDAMEELVAWKKRENNFDYKILYVTVAQPEGLIRGKAHNFGWCFSKLKNISSSDTMSCPTDTPSRKGLTIKPLTDDLESHPHTFQKSDTFFSEFKDHNDESLILSESPESYIIGNRASYDERQYPSWANPKWQAGVRTPAGMSFGHCLVIPKTRLYNIVDPDAVASDLAPIKEMTIHFAMFWNRDGNREKVIAQQDLAVEQQNLKLMTLALKSGKKCDLDACERIRREGITTSEGLSPKFLSLTSDDFLFAFHPFPHVSVGHLHMHALPIGAEMRKVSSKIHDWKSATLEAIHAVEQETPCESTQI